jgi:acyl-CoA synthetase (NDP forming)
MTTERASLSEIFSPRGVALVGATPAGLNSFATGAIFSLIQAGFPAIYPVNPKYTEVLGLPCYPSVRDIPGTVDNVLVSIPAESVLALLDDCAVKKVKSVQFFTAGFSESGYAERAELEKAMLRKAQAGGFRIIGPNCVGISVPKSRFITAVAIPLEPGSVAFISQSGGHAMNLPYFGSPRGLRFSKVVSYGNALDVDESELLDYLAQDPETEIIAAYIEGVRDGRRFFHALKTATAQKPVIIYKGGTTEAGRRTAFGHTASLTSSVAIFATLCRQARSIPVEDMDELTDVVVALRFARPIPQGIGVAVIGAGGGPSVLAGDEMEKAGLRVPHLSPEVQTQLRQFLPLAGSIFGNPIDAPNLIVPEAISATMRLLGQVTDIHMLLYHMGFHPISRWGDGRHIWAPLLEPIAEALSQAQQATGKPVLVALCPPPDTAGMADFLAAQGAFVKTGFPVFHSLRQAARAMASVIAWNQR